MRTDTNYHNSQKRESTDSQSAIITNMRNLLIIGCVLLTPYLVSAQLVPCEGFGPNGCNACHLVDLAQNVINFLITLSIGLAVLAFSWAGILMVTAAGNEGQVTKAKGIFTNVLIGITIALAAWLIIDTVMKLLVQDNLGGFGPWNTIQCVQQPTLNDIPIPFKGLTAAGFNDGTFTALDAYNLNLTGDEYDQICQIAANQGIGDQCSHLQALMAIESNGCKNTLSGANARGCMQIIPTTACWAETALRNNSCDPSDPNFLNKLRNDSAYNMGLAVDIYKDLQQRYGNNYDYIYAAYNGGPGSNDDSSSCPGKTIWQCQANPRYQETRDYVSAVRSVQDRIRTETAHPN